MNHNDPTPAVHVKRGRLRKRKTSTPAGVMLLPRRQPDKPAAATY